MNFTIFRRLHIIFIGGFLLLYFGGPVHADTRAQDFLDGVEHYNTGEYTKAVELFESIAGGGVQNGSLYYNIANAYLKQGKLGPAILWYERATRLIPGDPDLKFNLDYARSLLKDEAAVLGSPVLQVLFFWKDLLSVSAWQWVGITTAVFFWCLLATFCLSKKKILKSFIYCCMGLALLSSGTAVYLSNASVFHPRAVILDRAVSVRSGFSDDTTELFVLHEGTLVAVERKTGAFLKVRYAKDKIGWVSETQAGII